MKERFEAAKAYAQERRSELLIGLAVVLGIGILIAGIILVIYNNTPKVDYPPVAACELFTDEEASELLGENAVISTSTAPVVSGNTATSRCGYTDGNPQIQDMIVAAMTVRSGVNDNGVEQNKTEFAANRASDTVDAVENIGDSAYFNRELGQLNVLNGRDWIILSYGVGEEPTANTLDDALKFAKIIVNQ
jgi:hypothetical protein